MTTNHTSPRDSGSIDLEAIKARATAATPGPWEREKVYNEVSLVRIPDHQHHIGDLYTTSELDNRFVFADAEFIAHARSDIPALLAEVRRLQELLNHVCGGEV